MNLTSLITIPARLGYDIARTTIDVATGVVGGAARLVGLGGDAELPDPPADAPKPATRETKPRPGARSRTGQGTRAGSATKRSDAAGRTPSASRAAHTQQRAGYGKRTSGEKPTAPGSGPGDVGQSDDVTLTRKVETEIFRDADAPKGSVNVNSVDGVVWLRGRADNPEQVRELQRRALAVPGVKKVENLLHLQLPAEPKAAATEASEPQPGSELATDGGIEQPRRFSPMADESLRADAPDSGADEPLPAEPPDRGAAEESRSTMP